MAGSWQQVQATIATVWPSAERGDTWNNVHVVGQVGAEKQLVQVGLDLVEPDLEVVSIEAPVAEVDPVRLSGILEEIGSLALGVLGIKRLGDTYWVTLSTRLPLAIFDPEEATSLVLVVQLFGSAATTLAGRIRHLLPDPWPALREAITSHPEMSIERDFGDGFVIAVHSPVEFFLLAAQNGPDFVTTELSIGPPDQVDMRSAAKAAGGFKCGVVEQEDVVALRESVSIHGLSPRRLFASIGSLVGAAIEYRQLVARAGDAIERANQAAGVARMEQR